MVKYCELRGQITEVHCLNAGVEKPQAVIYLAVVFVSCFTRGWVPASKLTFISVLTWPFYLSEFKFLSL